ncbi:UDP-glucose 4-epimerase family protein [Massilia norwichensis]|uniref:SDR family oxidoreductase n=1 Tax=Massilia norwichensis TaxID=1442366 RepID=A0ABT2A5P6_9BURK|nr:SDR family oxidoreductase [Massilia norwichensis]MCS0589422.1 SDR family oxidoreductase [Massilia norwichensis]
MILVTGSNGFVGRELCQALAQRGIRFRAAVRTAAKQDQVAVGNLDGSTDWRAALAGCSAVIHLAARVHVMSDTVEDPLRAYREVNLEGTLRLARQAVEAGVKRFVFVSSVKVNGEATASTPFSAADRPAPCDPYGQSKMEAETALLELGRETGLEVVIVRPPLVYGPGVKANFLNLVKLVRLGLPLPFGMANGYRSMVAVENLVDLLITCTVHPNAPGAVFMVSDGQDMHVGDLVRMIAKAMGKNVFLLPVPPVVLRSAARLAGKSAVADRLFGSLQVDIGATLERLQWKPVVSPQFAIGRTVDHFLGNQESKTR